MMASYRTQLREDLTDMMQGSALAGWILNSNFNIVMPPYSPMRVDLKSMVPRKKSAKTQEY